jgi:hypothetical protein
MIPRRFREHRLYALAVLAGTILAVETACGGSYSGGPSEYQVATSETTPNGHVKEVAKKLPNGPYQYTIDGVVQPFLPGGFKARASAAALNSGNADQVSAQVKMLGKAPKRLGPLAAFKHFHADAVGSAHLNSSGNVQLSATALLTSSKHGAGSVCVRFSGTSKAPLFEQSSGKFTIVGGSGRAARARGDGVWRAIQAKARFRENEPISYDFRLGFKHVSQGHARKLSQACKDAAKPLPPPPALNATLTGFAFGNYDGQTATLPPGATIYPSGSTITGNVGCGSDNNLMAIISYSGPSGAQLTLSFYGGSIKTGRVQTANQGQNVFYLVSMPANSSGGYQLSGSADKQGFTEKQINGAVTLQRSC